MKRIISYLLLLSFALAFTACREKEPQPPVSQMKGVFYAGAPDLEEVIEIVPGKSKTVDVQAYAEAVSDLVLNLTLKVDPDGAAAYNSAHGTNYQMCPGSAYEFTTNKVLMPRYGKASTSAKLKISASGMEEDVIYVVPVTIDEVIGTDNWERSSSPYAYVLVKRAYVAPDAGSGTKNDPYNLYTAADMLKMSELLVPGTKVYFRMKADIDMEGIDWVPLNFASPYDNCVDFDGAGHTISNFTSTFANYPSFFGVLYGNVHDVTFANAVIESAVGGATGIIGSYCGTTVSGVLKAGEAHRVHVQGRVTSPGGNKNGTGALFGRICGANITTCSADVEIESGEDYVGGIFGYDTGASTVSDCWTKGSVKAGSKVGGIGGGFIKAESEMYNCFSLMTVEGSFQYAGILGHANLDQKNANTTNTPNNQTGPSTTAAASSSASRRRRISWSTVSARRESPSRSVRRTPNSVMWSPTRGMPVPAPRWCAVRTPMTSPTTAWRPLRTPPSPPWPVPWAGAIPCGISAPRSRPSRPAPVAATTRMSTPAANSRTIPSTTSSTNKCIRL